MITLSSQPRARNVLRFLAQTVVFGTVEVLAALALDGWLSIALWLIAAWNAALLLLAVWGLAVNAEEHAKAKLTTEGDPS